MAPAPPARALKDERKEPEAESKSEAVVSKRAYFKYGHDSNLTKIIMNKTKHIIISHENEMDFY